jgi:hypothetical protein
VKALLSAVAAALVLAAPAEAKELLRATLCGASACTTVTDRSTLNRIPAGETSEPLGPVAPYYRVEILVGEGANRENTHTFSLYYVPSENAMAWEESGIVRLHPIYGEQTTKLMRELTGNLEPFPAPRLTGVRVGGRGVDPSAAQSYVRLFLQTRESPLTESPTDWIHVDLRSATPSPWTEARPDLMYSPSTNLLEIGGNRMEVPNELAADIEAGRALDSSSSSFPWATLGLSALGALFLASLRRGR